MSLNTRLEVWSLCKPILHYYSIMKCHCSLGCECCLWTYGRYHNNEHCYDSLARFNNLSTVMTIWIVMTPYSCKFPLYLLRHYYDTVQASSFNSLLSWKWKLSWLWLGFHSFVLTILSFKLLPFAYFSH